MDNYQVYEFYNSAMNLVAPLESGKDDVPTAMQRRLIELALKEVREWLDRTK